MNNPKIIGWVGLGLLLLGTLSLVLVYLSGEVSAQNLHLAAGTGVLFSLGTSTLAIAGVQRLELRVKELEQKLGTTK